MVKLEVSELTARFLYEALEEIEAQAKIGAAAGEFMVSAIAMKVVAELRSQLPKPGDPV